MPDLRDLAEIEIRRYVVVDEDGTRHNHEYNHPDKALQVAASVGKCAVICRTYTYSGSELVWTPDRSNTWPPAGPDLCAECGAGVSDCATDGCGVDPAERHIEPHIDHSHTGTPEGLWHNHPPNEPPVAVHPPVKEETWPRRLFCDGASYLNEAERNGEPGHEGS